MSGLIGIGRTLYSCGFQYLQRARKKLKNAIDSPSLLSTWLPIPGVGPKPFDPSRQCRATAHEVSRLGSGSDPAEVRLIGKGEIRMTLHCDSFVVLGTLLGIQPCLLHGMAADRGVGSGP